MALELALLGLVLAVPAAVAILYRTKYFAFLVGFAWAHVMFFVWLKFRHPCAERADGWIPDAWLLFGWPFAAAYSGVCILCARVWKSIREAEARKGPPPNQPDGSGAATPSEGEGREAE
ncbi:MAG: hypothetical protein ACYTFI_04995 [Planctomycetota bacterium]